MKALYEFLRDHPELTLEWIGAQFPVSLDATRTDQAVACRLKKAHGNRTKTT
jgi:hypothetical protein